MNWGVRRGPRQLRGEEQNKKKGVPERKRRGQYCFSTSEKKNKKRKGL